MGEIETLQLKTRFIATLQILTLFFFSLSLYLFGLFSDLSIIKDVLDSARILNAKWKVQRLISNITVMQF